MRALRVKRAVTDLIVGSPSWYLSLASAELKAQRKASTVQVLGRLPAAPISGRAAVLQ